MFFGGVRRLVSMSAPVDWELDTRYFLFFLGNACPCLLPGSLEVGHYLLCSCLSNHSLHRRPSKIPVNIQQLLPMDSQAPTEASQPSKQSPYEANLKTLKELSERIDKRQAILPTLTDEFPKDCSFEAVQGWARFLQKETTDLVKDLKEAARLTAENQHGQEKELLRRRTAVEEEHKTKLKEVQVIFNEQVQAITDQRDETVTKHKAELESSFQAEKKKLDKRETGLEASFQAKREELAKHESDLEASYKEKEKALEKEWKDKEKVQLQKLEQDRQALNTKQANLHREREEFDKKVLEKDLEIKELRGKANAKANELAIQEQAHKRAEQDLAKLKTAQEAALLALKAEQEEANKREQDALTKLKADLEAALLELKTEQEEANKRERDALAKLKADQEAALLELKTEQEEALNREKANFEKLKTQEQDALKAARTTFLTDSLEALEVAKDNFNRGLGNGLAFLANRVPNLAGMQAWINTGAQIFAREQTRTISAKLDQVIRQSNGSVRLWEDNTRLLEENSQREQRIARLESRNTSLEKRNADMAREIGQVEGKLAAWTERALTLEGQVWTLTKLEGQVALLSEQLAKSQRQVADLKSQKGALEESKAELERQSLNLAESQKAMQRQVDRLEREKQTLSQNRTALQERVGLVESQNETLRQNETRLRDANRSLSQQNARFVQRLAFSEGQNLTLDESRSALSNENAGLRGQITGFERQVAGLEEERKRNKPLLDERIALLKAQTEEIDRLRKSIATVRDLQQKIRDEETRLRDENTAAKTEISGLKTQVSTLEDEKMALTQEVDNLKADNKSLEKDKNKFEQDKMSLTREVGKLQTEKSNWASNAEAAAQLQSEQAKSKLSEVTEKLDQANKEIKKLKVQYESARDFAAVLDEIKTSLRPAEVLQPPPPTPALSMSPPSTSPSATEQSRKRSREDSPARPEGRGRPDNAVGLFEQVVADLEEMGVWWHNAQFPLPALINHLSVLWSDHQARANWQEFLHAGDKEFHCFHTLVRSGRGESSRCKQNVKCSSRVNEEKPCVHVGVRGTENRLKTLFYLIN